MVFKPPRNVSVTGASVEAVKLSGMFSSDLNLLAVTEREPEVSWSSEAMLLRRVVTLTESEVCAGMSSTAVSGSGVSSALVTNVAWRLVGRVAVKDDLLFSEVTRLIKPSISVGTSVGVEKTMVEFEAGRMLLPDPDGSKGLPGIQTEMTHRLRHVTCKVSAIMPVRTRPTRRRRSG